MSTRRVRWSAPVFAAFVVLQLGFTPAGRAMDGPCVDRRLFAGERVARAELRCYSKAASRGEEASASCVGRARDRVRTDLAGCAHEDTPEVVGIAEAFVESVVPTVWASTLGTMCPASKLAAIEAAATSFIEAEREQVITGNSEKRTRLRSQVWRVLQKGFDRADVPEPCPDRPDVVIAALDDFAAALRGVTTCPVQEPSVLGSDWFVGFNHAELDDEYWREVNEMHWKPITMTLFPDSDGVGFLGSYNLGLPWGYRQLQGVITCDGSIFFENGTSLSTTPIWGIVEGNCIKGRVVASDPAGLVWIPWAGREWAANSCE